MSSPEIDDQLSDHFRKVLDQADELLARYDDAVALHARTKNPILRSITEANVKIRAKQAEDKELEAVASHQNQQLQTGEMPMFED